MATPAKMATAFTMPMVMDFAFLFTRVNIVL